MISMSICSISKTFSCVFILLILLVVNDVGMKNENGQMQGVVASGIAFAVQIWCIDRGGPVFVAVYQPVQTLVVAIMASVALGEEFYLGGSVPFLPHHYPNTIFSLSLSQLFVCLLKT